MKQQAFTIDLGTKVKDIVTDFSGVVVSRTERLGGNNRYGVQPQLKDGAPLDEQWFDEARLAVFKTGKVTVR